MEFWTLQEAAKRTSTSVSFWRKAIRHRDIPVTRIGRCLRLNATHVWAYLAARTRPAKDGE